MTEEQNKKSNRYSAIIQRIFEARYSEGSQEIRFARSEFQQFADQVGVELPKNLGDINYTFRYRSSLPESIRAVTPQGMEWIIRNVGRGLYSMVLRPEIKIEPNPLLIEVKIPDSTPGVVLKYSQDDEQALLAKLRYNRMIDIFTGVTCYSLQNHLRTFVPKVGQIETDEIYIGVDRRGAHYVFPVQAKGKGKTGKGKDKLHIVQIEQDLAFCAYRYPRLICRSIAAEFMANHGIALFSFEDTSEGAKMTMESHYKLVPHAELSPDDLQRYRETVPNE